MKRAKPVAGEMIATDLVYWGFRARGEKIPGVLVANYRDAKSLASAAGGRPLVRTYITVHLIEGRPKAAPRAKA